MPANNPIENLYISFCKQLLGVQKQSTNDGVLLELGQFPLIILAKKRATKNWVRMTTNENCSDILQNFFQYSCEQGLPWTENMKSMLSEIGLMECYVNPDPKAHVKLSQRLQDLYHQTTLVNIGKGESKLRTYALFKTAPGFEKYLDEISCVKKRMAFTKFRISNSALMIEKGRHRNIDRTLRFCPFCPNEVEDEQHFLMKCPIYKYLRSDLYSKIKSTTPSICNQPYNYRFLTLMNTTNSVPISCFISQAMDLREFLLAKHKTHD